MKKLTAFLFAVMCIFVLVGCNTQSNQSEQEKKDGTEDVNGGETELSWTVNPDCKPVYRALYEGDGRTWIDTITFKEDGTFEEQIQGIALRSLISQYERDGYDWHSLDCKTITYGTYTGDAAQNGEVNLTLIRKTDDEGTPVDFDDVGKSVIGNIRDDELVFDEEGSKEDKVHFYRVGYWKYSHDVVFFQYDAETEDNYEIIFKDDGTFITTINGDWIGNGYYIGNAAGTSGKLEFLHVEELIYGGKIEYGRGNIDVKEIHFDGSDYYIVEGGKCIRKS